MHRHFARLLSARTGDSGTRVRVSSAYSCPSLVWQSLCVFLLGCLSLSTSCSSVQSSVEAIVTGEPPTDETYAGLQHFPVTPHEAVACLITITPHEGWEVVSTGEEYSTRGAHGAFFRLEPLDPSSDKKALSGVFYAEPSGSYVRVSEQNGLPEPLVEPLITEIKRKRREREQ
jgi:hypothetical protein